VGGFLSDFLSLTDTVVPMTVEHEYPKEPNSGGQFACVICGAVKHPQMTATCFDRPTPGNALMPAPARRQYASEAFDAIGARVVELRAERLAVLNAPAPAEMSEEDLMCG